MKVFGQRFLGFLILAPVFWTLTGCSTANNVKMQDSKTADAGSISEISKIRRVLRSACGKLRLVNAGADNKESILEQAQKETASALSLWQELGKKYEGNAPSEYSKHPDWKAAFEEIQSGIKKMHEDIIAKTPDVAFKTCGQTCGKFVELNSGAQIRRTSDILFKFRKTAKPLEPIIKNQEIDKVLSALPEIEKIRNEAMKDPVGGTGTLQEKKNALDDFSEKVDDFCQAVRNKNIDVILDKYALMMSAMEKAYDLFL